MKIRNGFVSNSSSSSFVVVSDNKDTLLNKIPKEFLIKDFPYSWDKNLWNYKIIIPISSGQKEFGWEFKRYYGFASKLNYAYIQAFRLNSNLKEKYLDMIREVLKSHLEDSHYLDIRFDYNQFYWYSILDDYCNIDHQSAYYELEEDLHYIFRDKETLNNFLFNEESYIQCGNDNNDPTKEWIESSKKSQEYFNLYGPYEEEDEQV